MVNELLINSSHRTKMGEDCNGSRAKLTAHHWGQPLLAVELLVANDGWVAVLSRPSASEGGGRRPAFTATEVDGWQHKAQPGVSKPAARAAVQAAD
jgi:hypothetical protein